MDLILIILLGWPGAIVGLLFLITGIATKNRKFGIIGAIVAMGFCLYTSLYPPPTRWLSISAVICNWASALWNRGNKTVWQIVLLLPMILLITWLTYIVFSEQSISFSN